VSASTTDEGASTAKANFLAGAKRENANADAAAAAAAAAAATTTTEQQPALFRRPLHGAPPNVAAVTPPPPLRDRISRNVAPTVPRHRAAARPASRSSGTVQVDA